MTQTVRFVDGPSYTEADQSDFNLRMMRPQGIIPESTLGTLTVSAIGSMNVRVGPGEAFIQGFQYKNDANVDLAIGANSSGSTRIDVVVLSLNRAGNTLVLAIHAGVAGAGVPALTQVAGGNWEHAVAQITVPNAAASIVGGNIADVRTYSRWPATAIDAAITTDTELAAEAALRSAADTAESTARSSADTTESTARTNADNTLQTNINNEAATRGGADTTLQNNINSEASTRSSSDATLQNNINSEATTRSGADSAETTARAAADAALNTRVTALEAVQLRAAVFANGAGTAINFVGTSSVVRTGTGQYTITLATAMPHTVPFVAVSTTGPFQSVSYTVLSTTQLTVTTSVDIPWSLLVWY